MGIAKTAPSVTQFMVILFLITTLLMTFPPEGAKESLFISSPHCSQSIETVPTSIIDQSPWPMFRHDTKHTGSTIFTGPATPTIAWTFTTNDGIACSPAIAADGTIYIGSGCDFRGSNDPYLYALNQDGSLKWKFKANDGFFSSPAIGPNGIIYLTSLDGRLYAIKDNHTSGILQWKKFLEYSFNLCSPLIGEDGTIYVGSPSFKFYAINPDGSLKWNYKTDWCIISSAAIDDDGTIYVGSKDHYLYAFTEAVAHLKWKHPMGTFFDGHLVDSSPAIGPDGTIYVGTDPYGAAGQTPVPVTTNFWAINPDGSLKWVFETEDGVESSPAVGPDGTIYVGSYDGYLYAINDTGTEGVLQWKFKTNGAIDGSPVVDGDGTIYIGSRDNNLYAIYTNGTLKWTVQTGDGIESSPSIDGNGLLYIGSFDGNLYVIGTGQPDVGVHSIQFPTHVSPGMIYTPKAFVRNFRAQSQNFSVTCSIAHESQEVYNDTVAAYVTNGAIQEISFTPWTVELPTNITYVVTVTTELPSDENPSNDQCSLVTMTVHNQAPNSPTIDGPTTGKTGEIYTFKITAIDPDENAVYYWVEWGDKESQGFWDGPYSSGVEITWEHSWEQQGIYPISVKVKDECGMESDWTHQEMTIAKWKVTTPFMVKLMRYYIKIMGDH